MKPSGAELQAIRETAIPEIRFRNYVRRVLKYSALTPRRMCEILEAEDVGSNIREICICAAVRAEDGTVIRGQAHADCFESIIRRKKKIGRKPDDQGFITSRQRYVTRDEGRRLQDAAGIKSVREEGYVGDTLFSEDLY